MVRTLSLLPVTVPSMDEIRLAGMILAGLELAPADPSDMTALLLSAPDRNVLFGSDEDNEPGLDDEAVTPLARYLAEHIDHARVEHWTKIVDRGVGEGRYSLIPVTDPDYPARLRQAWDAPPLLFCSIAASKKVSQDAASRPNLGEALNTRPSLAIVGSRETNRQVFSATESIASQLAAAGVTIVSGLAEGVDTAAHRGALDAYGYTVAVMGTGIERVYPQSNHSLAAAIERGGALVSQFPPSAPPTRTSFLLRNHVIAAMSDASLVMDGAERSGSRYEVERAIKYGRIVLAWAPSLGHRRWMKELVDAGSVYFVETVAQIREHLARSES